MSRRAVPYISAALVAMLLIGAMSVLWRTPRQEVRLHGQWQEVSWNYEKVDGQELGLGAGSTIGEELRKEITKGLVIHESETWRFEPGASLVLHKSGERNDTLKWKLKGHGHMLQLVFGDHHQEVYQVRELKDDMMVLQFNNDMIARGVVRIVFKRITDNAQEIQRTA